MPPSATGSRSRRPCVRSSQRLFFHPLVGCLIAFITRICSREPHLSLIRVYIKHPSFMPRSARSTRVMEVTRHTHIFFALFSCVVFSAQASGSATLAESSIYIHARPGRPPHAHSPPTSNPRAAHECALRRRILRVPHLAYRRRQRDAPARRVLALRAALRHLRLDLVHA